MSAGPEGPSDASMHLHTVRQQGYALMIAVVWPSTDALFTAGQTCVGSGRIIHLVAQRWSAGHSSADHTNGSSSPVT